MPETAQKKRREDVGCGPGIAAPIAAERDVEIFAQEPRQRDVPAVPEVADVGRPVRRVEIDRHFYVEQACRAERHVGVAREIEIDLHRVGQHRQPRGRRTQCRRRPEAGVGDRRERIRDKHLFHETDREQERAGGEVGPLRTLVRRVRELRHHLAVMQDRAGEQVREERDEKRVVGKERFLRFAPIDVDQISDLSEREKADAQRQREMKERRRIADQVRRVDEEEVGVFEYPEQCKIRRDSERQHRARRPRLQQARNAEIEGDAAEDQRQMPRIPPAVEKERCDREPDLRGERTPAEQEEDDEGSRKEPDQVLVAVEQHGGCVVGSERGRSAPAQDGGCPRGRQARPVC